MAVEQINDSFLLGCIIWNPRLAVIWGVLWKSHSLWKHLLAVRAVMISEAWPWGDWEAFHDLLWSTHWGFLEVSVVNDYILVGAGREKWRGKKW